MNQTYVSERIAAIIALTLIAGMSVAKIPEPDNIVINIVVAIAAFISGAIGVKK